MCLQTFQLFSSEVAPLVWDEESRSAVLQEILQALMDIVLRQVCLSFKKKSNWKDLIDANASERVNLSVFNFLFFFFCFVVLQQGHMFSGRHCCVHADKHGTRGWRRRSSCLESAAGLSLW